MRTKAASQPCAKADWSRRWEYSGSPTGYSPQKATSGDSARAAVTKAVASWEVPGPQVAVATPTRREVRA